MWTPTFVATFTSFVLPGPDGGGGFRLGLRPRDSGCPPPICNGKEPPMPEMRTSPSRTVSWEVDFVISKRPSS